MERLADAWFFTVEISIPAVWFAAAIRPWPVAVAFPVAFTPGFAGEGYTGGF